MDTQMIFDFTGYFASALCLVSMAMSDVLKLRVVNCISCIVFVVYGLLISAVPVAVFNAVTLFVNIYQIVKLKKQAKN